MRKLLLIISLFLYGCAAGVEARLDTARNSYMLNNYAEVTSQNELSNQDNLELLMTADSLFHSNNFDTSDKAYEEFNKRNIDLTGLDVGREAGALLGGNLANSYRPYMMDALFVSYYQLWVALAQGRFDNARVIINQSYNRQQKMSEEYAKLIESNKEAQSQDTSTSELMKTLNAENSQWSAFRNIMNPALMYLSGVVFLNTGKFEDAKLYLKRANGMMSNNGNVKTDLALAQSGAIPSNTAWVFIETGFAPRLHEKRLDIPFFLGNGIDVVSMAVSEPEFFNGPIKIDNAQLLANVDAMFMTEYSEYRINEALRSWASAVSKATLQAAMYNSGSDYAGLMGMAATIYSIASTSAEVRSWAILPQNIWTMRVNKNSDSILIKSNGNVLANVQVPKSGNHLIYVRLTQTVNDTKLIKIR